MENNQITQDTKPNMFEALKEKVTERLKWYRDETDTDFCVVDRVAGFYFYEIFRESLYTYDSNVLICERLFFKDKCKSAIVPVKRLTDEQKNIVQDFLKFSENIPNIAELSEEQQQEITEKLNNYQATIESEVKPVTEEKEALFYNDESTTSTYLLTALKDIPDESIEYISTIITSFIGTFFQTMAYSIEPQELEVRGISYDDYVDIIVVLK